MAEDNNGPERDDALKLRIEQVKKVKDIDPDLLSNGDMDELMAALEYVSEENEFALRQQAMRELGYS